MIQNENTPITKFLTACQFFYDLKPEILVHYSKRKNKFVISAGKQSIYPLAQKAANAFKGRKPEDLINSLNLLSKELFQELGQQLYSAKSNPNEFNRMIKQFKNLQERFTEAVNGKYKGGKAGGLKGLVNTVDKNTKNGIELFILLTEKTIRVCVNRLANAKLFHNSNGIEEFSLVPYQRPTEFQTQEVEEELLNSTQFFAKEPLEYKQDKEKSFSNTIDKNTKEGIELFNLFTERTRACFNLFENAKQFQTQQVEEELLNATQFFANEAFVDTQDETSLKKRVAYLASLYFNICHNQINVMTKLNWWDVIIDDEDNGEKIILGALPLKYGTLRNDLEELINLGIEAVLSVTEEWEMKINAPGLFIPITKEQWEERGCEHMQLSAEDFKTMPIEAIEKGVEFIRKNVLAKKPVLIHCKAGKGRSVLVFVCYLIKYHKMSVEKAFETIKVKRQQAGLKGVKFKTACEYMDRCSAALDSSVDSFVGSAASQTF